MLAGAYQIDVIRCLRHQAHASWQLSKRVIDDHIIYLVLDGAIDLDLAGERCRWDRGQIAWVGPGVPQHGWPAPGGDPPVFIVCRFKLEEAGQPVPAPVPPFVVDDGLALRSELDSLSEQLEQPGVFAGLQIRALLGQVCAGLLARRSQPVVRGALTPVQQRALRTWLLDHVAHAPTAADLADVVGMSQERFRQAFRLSFGRSPRQWLGAERLRLAAERLAESDESIEAVAGAMGYQSVPTFSRMFTRAYGVAPARYRNRPR